MASIAFGSHIVWITMASPQQLYASIHCVRLAHCFTGAKEQFFSQKTLKKCVKMAELFITNPNC